MKAVISRCVVCQKYEGQSFPPPLAPRKSEYVELNYLGPLYVKLGTELKKSLVCLFTCLTVRDVHLKWVLDLTAVQFLKKIYFKERET